MPGPRLSQEVPGGHARFSQQTRDSFDVLGWQGCCFFARPESQPQFGASEDVGCFRAGPVEPLDSRSIAFRPPAPAMERAQI